ncbi:MAG TPA: hypothetical protein VFM61_06555, partial [Pseudidiomarina sp.]|nr:hypothetical protein [Pseudidiomarina sp.]
MPSTSALAAELELAPSASISQLQVGSEILIELTNQSESFRIEQNIPNISGSRTLIARLIHPSRYGIYIATYSEGYVSAVLNLDGVSYQFDSVGTDGNWYSDASIVQDRPQLSVTSVAKIDKSERPDMTHMTDDVTVIDVHFHYNDEVRFEYREFLDARIDHLVNSANYFLADSNVNARVRAQATYRNYSNFSFDSMLNSYLVLDRNTRSGRNLKASTGYDAIFLMNTRAGNVTECLDAPLLNPTEVDYSEYAIGAFSIDCADETFAEVLVRTLGIQSSRRASDGVPSPFEGGYGYGVPGEFYTLAAKREEFRTDSVQSPKKILRFSSPLLDCDGAPCGVPIGQAGSADSVQVINDVIAVAAEANQPISNRLRYSQMEHMVTDYRFVNCIRDYNQNQSSYVVTWRDH